MNQSTLLVVTALLQVEIHGVHSDALLTQTAFMFIQTDFESKNEESSTVSMNTDMYSVSLTVTRINSLDGEAMTT